MKIMGVSSATLTFVTIRILLCSPWSSFAGLVFFSSAWTGENKFMQGNEAAFVPEEIITGR